MDIALIVKATAPILYTHEGKYTSVNANDNGAVSIGKIQWHATRALNLLKKVVSSNRTEAKELLGAKLYSEITTVRSWSERTFTKTESARVSKLLATPQGIIAQDKQLNSDITLYVNHGIKLGIQDNKTLVYYADVENQGGAAASKRIGNAAIAKAGKAEKVTLDIYHACALADKVIKKYSERRRTVYAKCKKLNFKSIPSVNPYTTPKATVRKGSRGENVFWVQWELRQAGFTTIKQNGIKKTLKLDGVFGSITEEGVKQFQKKKKLKADGIAGTNTIRALSNN